MLHDYWRVTKLSAKTVFDPLFSKEERYRATRPCFAMLSVPVPPSYTASGFNVVYLSTSTQSRAWINEFNLLFSKTMHIFSFKNEKLTSWETQELESYGGTDSGCERTALSLVVKGKRSSRVRALEWALIPILQIPRGFLAYSTNELFKQAASVEGVMDAYNEYILEHSSVYGLWSRAKFTFADLMLLADPSFLMKFKVSDSFKTLAANNKAKCYPYGTELCNAILNEKKGE